MKDDVAIRCVSCHETYVPDPKGKPGCPHCGGLSWVATWIAEAVTRG